MYEFYQRCIQNGKIINYLCRLGTNLHQFTYFCLISQALKLLYQLRPFLFFLVVEVTILVLSIFR